jgi:hypothetical protein
MLLAYTAPIWVLAAVLTWIPIAGGRSSNGSQSPAGGCGAPPAATAVPARIVTPRPVGNLALPGDMARLREYTDPETGAGMIHDPHAAT